MKREEATVIIKNCLEAEYETGKYEKLIANILTTQYQKINSVKPNERVRHAFQDSIDSYTVLGSYKDSGGQKIALLEVHLKNTGSLQNARTMQRNFVADFLREGSLGRQDAALVAFIPPDANDWRFSLVKMEYSLGIIEGKIKTNEELTPARRWSFLVGKHEKSHTAQSRLLPLVMEESHGTTLKELEKAFDVETVTDEFFGQYKECFFRFKDEIDRVIASSEHDRAHFESIGLDTANFAKKTLGQLAFLYFLQKKGWFGVASDNEWGKGPKDFLRKLFERREKYGNNFFNDILEPLFYEALATDRGDSALYIRLNNCRIPFLNGGLFEPMKGYAWETTDLTISDEVFSNTHKMKNGDIGDGIFDVFDRYNFTVSEDEPLEKEVAVDPEMLGKIFENLLEIKDRKSTGAFYTPRPIVHYMCQESLIEYLAHTDTTLPHTDIEFFIRESEATLENDRTTKKKIEEKSQNGYQYSGTYTYKTPESIRSRAKMLDDALASVRIADPAVGSGAFPLGLINEIVRARQILAIYTGSQKSTYDLKLHAIQENIYGVDLNPGAVEICQLRLWLSLIVDETIPHPLPNLNYRIMQGNSLIEEYEGVKLYDPKLLSHTKLVGKNEFNDERIDLFTLENSQSNRLYELLQHKLKKFIETSERTKKQTLKREIDQMKYDLIEITLREQGKEEKIAEIRRLREDNITPFFIWQLEFCEVFQEKGGFDIVIGNPPYGANIDGYINLFSKKFPETTKGFKEIYKLFYDKALSDLLKNEGILAYINPNTVLLQPRYEDLRKFLLKYSILQILNLGDGVFKNVVAPTCIIICKNIKNSKNLKYFEVSKNGKYVGLDFSNCSLVNQDEFTQNKSTLFVVGAGILDESLIPLGDIMELKDGGIKYQRVNVGLSEKGKNDLAERLFYDGDRINKDDIRYYIGKDIDKYGYSINLSVERYMKYNYASILRSNERLYWNKELIQIPEKIIWRQTSSIFLGTYIDTPIYFGNTIQGGYLKEEAKQVYNLKSILGLLNSRYLRFLYAQKVQEGGRVFPQVKLAKLRDLPIPKITPSNQPIVTQIESLVDQILKIKSQPVHQDTLMNTATPSLRATPQEGNGVDTRELEQEIDRLVYELYGLTSEEIAMVEGSSKQ